MLKIREEQSQVLREAAVTRQIEEAAEYIWEKLRESTPEVLAEHSHEDAIIIIKEVIEAARGWDVVDIADVTQWCYLRFATKTKFYEMAKFKHFLDDPLLHPERKGKAVVEAFVIAQKQKRD